MDMEAGKTLTNEEVIRELLDLLKKNAMKEQANDVFEIDDGKRKIQAITGKDFDYPLLEEEKGLIEIKTQAVNNRKSEKIVGQMEIYLAKRLLFSGNLYKL